MRARLTTRVCHSVWETSREPPSMRGRLCGLPSRLRTLSFFLASGLARGLLGQTLRVLRLDSPRCMKEAIRACIDTERRTFLSPGWVD